MDKRSVVPLVLIPVDATAVNGFKPAVHWHSVKANITELYRRDNQ